MTASIVKTLPVMSRCLFHTGLFKLTMITPHIPFRIVMLIITINTIFTHGLIPVNPNKDTVSEESGPFPNVGMNISMARRMSRYEHQYGQKDVQSITYKNAEYNTSAFNYRKNLLKVF